MSQFYQTNITGAPGAFTKLSISINSAAMQFSTVALIYNTHRKDHHMNCYWTAPRSRVLQSGQRQCTVVQLAGARGADSGRRAGAAAREPSCPPCSDEERRQKLITQSWRRHNEKHSFTRFSVSRVQTWSLCSTSSTSFIDHLCTFSTLLCVCLDHLNFFRRF